MTTPTHPPSAQVLTAFDHVLRQSEASPAISDAPPVPATQVYDQLDVAGFLELQAQAMRNNGFRAGVHAEGVETCLTWTPVRGAEAGVYESKFTVKAVDGTERPFRGQFSFPGINTETAITGVSSQHLDAKLLSRWFAVFVDQALTAAAVRTKRDDAAVGHPVSC